MLSIGHLMTLRLAKARLLLAIRLFQFSLRRTLSVFILVRTHRLDLDFRQRDAPPD